VLPEGTLETDGRDVFCRRFEQKTEKVWQILEYSDSSFNQLISVTDLRVIPTTGVTLESPAIQNGTICVIKENEEAELRYRAPA
jgi:hypothetical protein